MGSAFSKSKPSNRRPAICKEPGFFIPPFAPDGRPTLPGLIAWLGHSYRPQQPRVAALVQFQPDPTPQQWSAEASNPPWRLEATLTLASDLKSAKLHFDLWYTAVTPPVKDDQHEWTYPCQPKSAPESPALDWIETFPPGRIRAKIGRPTTP